MSYQLLDNDHNNYYIHTIDLTSFLFLLNQEKLNNNYLLFNLQS